MFPFFKWKMQNITARPHWITQLISLLVLLFPFIEVTSNGDVLSQVEYSADAWRLSSHLKEPTNDEELSTCGGRVVSSFVFVPPRTGTFLISAFSRRSMCKRTAVLSVQPNYKDNSDNTECSLTNAATVSFLTLYVFLTSGKAARIRISQLDDDHCAMADRAETQIDVRFLPQGTDILSSSGQDTVRISPARFLVGPVGSGKASLLKGNALNGTEPSESPTVAGHSPTMVDPPMTLSPSIPPSTTTIISESPTASEGSSPPPSPWATTVTNKPTPDYAVTFSPTLVYETSSFSPTPEPSVTRTKMPSMRNSPLSPSPSSSQPPTSASPSASPSGPTVTSSTSAPVVPFTTPFPTRRPTGSPARRPSVIPVVLPYRGTVRKYLQTMDASSTFFIQDTICGEPVRRVIRYEYHTVGKGKYTIEARRVTELSPPPPGCPRDMYTVLRVDIDFPPACAKANGTGPASFALDLKASTTVIFDVGPSDNVSRACKDRFLPVTYALSVYYDPVDDDPFIIASIVGGFVLASVMALIMYLVYMNHVETIYTKPEYYAKIRRAMRMCTTSILLTFLLFVTTWGAYWAAAAYLFALGTAIVAWHSHSYFRSVLTTPTHLSYLYAFQYSRLYSRILSLCGFFLIWTSVIALCQVAYTSTILALDPYHYAVDGEYALAIVMVVLGAISIVLQFALGVISLRLASRLVLIVEHDQQIRKVLHHMNYDEHARGVVTTRRTGYRTSSSTTVPRPTARNGTAANDEDEVPLGVLVTDHVLDAPSPSHGGRPAQSPAPAGRVPRATDRSLSEFDMVPEKQTSHEDIGMV